ncbi:MAG: CDP-glycerol glycerophosphotransferase family protein [Actinomycetota bacterium]
MNDVQEKIQKKQWGRNWLRAISDREERKRLFHEMQQTVDCHPNLIFYESMSGAKMMDSPFSIFEDLFNSPSTKNRYLHAWSAKSENVVSPRYRGLDSVKVVKRHTPAYFYYLARAKYIVSNSALPEYFVRRPMQRYLNTWHGIGYKTLGRTDRNPLGAALAVSNMLQATHVISPCEFMTRIHLNGFSMANTFTGKFAETGYPRIDATLNSTSGEQNQLLSILGCDADEKVVTYAPTWRGEGFDVNRLRTDLHRLAQLDCTVVFLGHHLMLKHISDDVLAEVVVPPEYVNTNVLLSVTSVLITDYSSIFFDFLVTGRPIIHYVYDHCEYSKDRGLNLTLDELPGRVASTTEELIDAVLTSTSPKPGRTDAYRRCVARFNPYDNGNSTREVVDWFFNDTPEGVQQLEGLNQRHRVAYWGGRLGNGPALDDYFHEIQHLAEDTDTEVTLFISRSVRRNSAAVQLIRELGSSISVVVRDEYSFGMTTDECAAREVPASQRSGLETAAYNNIYKREYRRLFGDTRFDEVRQFPNLSHFWKRLAQEANM